MSEAFCQELCSMEPFKDSMRWVLTRPRTVPSTVRVADGELTITQETGEVVARVPTAGLKVVTPSRLRKMEVGVVLEIGGKPVAVMFDLVHSRQRFRAASKEGKGALIGEVAKPVAGTRGNMGLARQITAEFMAALLACGAIDMTALPSFSVPPVTSTFWGVRPRWADWARGEELGETSSLGARAQQSG